MTSTSLMRYLLIGFENRAHPGLLYIYIYTSYHLSIYLSIYLDLYLYIRVTPSIITRTSSSASRIARIRAFFRVLRGRSSRRRAAAKTTAGVPAASASRNGVGEGAR